MRALVQRVSSGQVRVEGEIVGAVGRGLCALVGVTHDDTPAHAARLAAKVWGLRVFPGDDDVRDCSAADVGAEILVVSQFTLYGDTRKGRRPSYVAAAPGPIAEPLVDRMVEELAALGATVATGRFGAEMHIDLACDGPVTLMIEV